MRKVVAALVLVSVGVLIGQTSLKKSTPSDVDAFIQYQPSLSSVQENF